MIGFISLFDSWRSLAELFGKIKERSEAKPFQFRIAFSLNQIQIELNSVTDCQYVLPVNSREAKEIEQSVKRLTWDTNDLIDRAVSISYIKKVENQGLEREYHEKRASMRDEGRSPKELTQQLAFCVEKEDSRVKEICRVGLVCDGVDHSLGDGHMGVTVWRYPDLCLRAFSWPTSGTAYLVVFKVGVYIII